MTPLYVQPILLYGIHERKEKTSWRPWGSIQTKEDAEKESKKIQSELDELHTEAEYPLIFQSLQMVRTYEEIQDLNINTDVILVYAAGVQESNSLRPFEEILAFDLPTLFFLRRNYLWYEIIHPRFLRKNESDDILQPVIIEDIIVDDYSDLLSRLRSMYGLKHAIGTKIISIGKASGWGVGEEASQKAKEQWNFELVEISYEEVKRRMIHLKTNEIALHKAENDADEYLLHDHVMSKTNRTYIVNAFLLERLFRELLNEQDAKVFTIEECMSTIMPIAETTACLPLSILNDSGYLAFCESDFVVIPAGILLHYISQKPVFLVDPTLPYKGEVVVAHCTAPRRMNGSILENVEVVTHFESDFGAALCVKFKEGQIVTVVDPAFSGDEWIGFRGTIVENTALPICRSQINIEIHGDWKKLLREMKGFHWMIVYGDYLEEVGYALNKMKIKWTNLSSPF